MGRYFTEEERYLLERLLKKKMKYREIAELLDKSLSTIKREVKRGTVTLISTQLMKYDAYCADYAQDRYDIVKQRKGSKSKFECDEAFKAYLTDKIINKKYSPYAALTSAEKENKSFKTHICLKTLYNCIHRGVLKAVNCEHLHLQKPKKEKKEKSYTRPIKPERTSIEERPQIINERMDVNHWEMDTVVSGQTTTSKQALLVMTERLSNLTLVRKLAGKTQEAVLLALDTLEQQTDHFKNVFRTITMDNGTEFLDNEGIERSSLSDEQRTQTFYCHAYSAFERGANENVNRLIRYHIPKGADIGDYTDEDVQYIEHWLNNYPRKKFGGLSANEVYKNLMDYFNS